MKKPKTSSAKMPKETSADFEELIRKAGQLAMDHVARELEECSPVKRKRSEAATPEQVSARGDAERFAAAANQAFREAFPQSRIDGIMTEGFRIAERAAKRQR